MIKTLALSSVALSSLFLASCDDDNNDSNSVTVPRTIQIQFEATGPNGFAPVFFAAHDGDFDFFDTGSAATSQLETMAELGDVSQVLSFLKDTDNSAQSTSPMAPGSNFTVTLTTNDTNRYFSYGGMLLPSSDAFIGNNNPTQFDLNQLIEDANGDPIVINVTRVYDAGTEVNDFLTAPGGPLVGAPTGVATDSVTENGVISLIDSTHFASYANPGSFDASTLDSQAGTIIGRITLTVLP